MITTTLQGRPYRLPLEGQTLRRSRDEQGSSSRPRRPRDLREFLHWSLRLLFATD